MISKLFLYYNILVMSCLNCPLLPLTSVAWHKVLVLQPCLPSSARQWSSRRGEPTAAPALHTNVEVVTM